MTEEQRARLQHLLARMQEMNREMREIKPEIIQLRSLCDHKSAKKDDVLCPDCMVLMGWQS